MHMKIYTNRYHDFTLLFPAIIIQEPPPAPVSNVSRLSWTRSL